MIFYIHVFEILQGGASFVDPFCYLRFVFVSAMLSCLFLRATWVSCVSLDFSCTVFVTFPYGAPGQVWY